MSEENIFTAALQKETPAERAAYLDAACGDDAALRARVEALLEADEQSGDFLEKPPPGIDADPDAPTEPGPRNNVPVEGPGDRIGNLRLIEIIDEGGMGIVYLAEEEYPIRRIVAVKVLKAGSDSERIVSRFNDEHRTLAAMNNPNIAVVHYAGIAASRRPYFVMELIEGRKINEYCDKKRLTIRQRLELFIPVCRAIHHANQKRVIHRDIKPGNILVAEYDGRATPKVIDFGIAQAVGGSPAIGTNLASSGTIAGTQGYMSPEQATSSVADVRNDVYALGAVLHELLTGVPPEWQDGASAIREQDPLPASETLLALRGRSMRVAADRKVRLGSLVSLLRSELEWIPMKALQTDPDRRYASASELAADIENYLQDKPLSDAPKTLRYRLRKGCRRNRIVVRWVAAIVLLAAASAGLFVARIITDRNRLKVEQVKTVKALAAAEVSRDEAQRQRAAADRQRSEALCSEREATRQRDIADAVLQFQIEMLSSADPVRGLGDKVTVLQVAREAIDQLNAGTFNDQPLLDAAEREAIGDTMTSLGRFDDAEPLLRQALETRRKLLPPGDRDIARSLNDLATLLDEKGERSEAEKLEREALAIDQREPSVRPLDLALTLNGLGLLLKEENRLDEAEPLLREALDLRRRELPPGRPDIGLSLNNLALVLIAEGRPDAEPMLREVVAIFRHAAPAGNPVTATALNNLGSLLQGQGRYAEAEPLFRETLEIYRRRLPEKHPLIALCLNNLGGALKDQNKVAEAEPLFRQALEMRRQTLPPGHPDIASTLNNLGKLLQGMNQMSEAEKMLREALDINRSAPDRHAETVGSLNALSLLLLDENKVAEADPLLREALKTCRQWLAPDHSLTATTLGNLAMLLGEFENRPADGEALCRELIVIRRKALPTGERELAAGLKLQGLLLRLQGKRPEAEAALREALTHARHSLPAGHRDIANILNDLGLVLEDEGRLADAETIDREAVSIRRKALPAGHPDLASSLTNLGNVLQREGRLGEAEPLCREAVDIDRQGLPPAHPLALAVLSNLIALLEAESKFDEAEKVYRDELAAWRTRLAPDDPNLGQLLSRLAGYPLTSGRFADAEPLFREAVAIFRKKRPPDNLATANALSGLGRSLTGMKRYAEAEPLLRQALAVRRQKLGQDAQPTQLTAAALADLLERTGRADESAEIRKEYGLSGSAGEKSSTLPSAARPAP